MRHFLFGIQLGYTILAPYPASTCFIDLSSRCVHDDDVEIIKQIDVKNSSAFDKNKSKSQRMDT